MIERIYKRMILSIYKILILERKGKEGERKKERKRKRETDIEREKNQERKGAKHRLGVRLCVGA